MQRLHDVRGNVATDTHLQTTSTGTADVKSIVAPADAVAVMLNCATNDARYTLDGSTPTATQGLLLKKDQNPLYIAAGKTIKFVSGAAANCVVDSLWLK